jgi:hypothetical protein
VLNKAATVMLKLVITLGVIIGWAIAYREFAGRGVGTGARNPFLRASGSLFDMLLFAVLAIPVFLVAYTLSFLDSVLTVARMIVRSCLKAWTEQVMRTEYHEIDG